MMVAVIDYGSSNLFSVVKAFERAGVAQILLTSNPHDLEKASHIVLPGQGAFADGMQALSQKKLTPVIQELVKKKKKPFLGICLGMQLLSDIGFEHGETKGLGLVSGKTIKLETVTKSIKLPHIGWDTLEIRSKSKLLRGLSPSPDVYFVHSFYVLPKHQEIITATCTYGQTFPVVLEQENINATLFHPEKSQKNGAIIIKNFLNL